MKGIRAVVLASTVMAAGLHAESLIQKAPAKAVQKQNPFKDDENASRAGGKLYARECASCHGTNREGGRKAPGLNGQNLRDAPSGKLLWILTNGSLHSGMPSFAHLPEAQRWQIVTFLQGK